MRNFFVSLLKIFLLFALCVFSAFAVSFPLWIFSTKAPFAYTAVFLFFFFAAFVYGIIKTFKKYGIPRTIRVIVFVLVAFFALYTAVKLVFLDMRIPAILLILAAFVFEVFFMRITGKKIASKK